jgi:hypothetical protein
MGGHKVQAWQLLVYKVPSEPTSCRVYVWRKLKRLGAVLLHNAVWVLPASARTREQFQWLAAEIEEMNGEALVWESTLLYGHDEALVRQFLALADDAYGDLLVELERPGADLPALSRRYQQARSQDYFESDLGQRILAALMKERGGTER